MESSVLKQLQSSEQYKLNEIANQETDYFSDKLFERRKLTLKTQKRWPGVSLNKGLFKYERVLLDFERELFFKRRFDWAS